MTELPARSAALALVERHGSQRVLTRLVNKALRIVTAPQAIALADQALVSGASFFTTVLIGRYTFPSQLGTYALASAALIWLTNAQESLVSLPYTIRRSQVPELAAVQAGHALMLSSLLSALAVIVVSVAALSAFTSAGGENAAMVMWALAAVAPFVIHRDFARRFAFADLRNVEALALDCTIVVLQLGTLVWLAWTERLNGVTALAALGTACAASVLIWLMLVRHEFRFTPKRLPETLVESWTVGKWLFANQLLAALQSQMTLWFVALAAGAAATGVYTACLSIALFTNPIILGVSNMLWAKAARAFQEGGSARLLRESIADAAQLGALVGVFCFGTIVWGDDILSLLYPAHEYSGYGGVVTILALGQLAYGIGMPASTALASMGHVRTNFCVAVLETVLMTLLVWPLVFHFGLIGAAYGILGGCILRLFIRWTAVLIVLRTVDLKAANNASMEALAPLLHRLARGGRRWEAEPIDLNGCQGHIFAAKPIRAQPTCHGDEALIIKLYRPDRNLDVAEIRAQYDALQRLHSELNGRTFCDWTVCVPVPVVASDAPPALVMTRVPGQKLAACLYQSAAADTGQHPATAAVANALMALWSSGLSHGDLTIENILCEEESRSLSFVDCGPKSECGAYAHAHNRRDLALHDLAHLLSHEAETLFTTWGRTKLRLQRQLFIQGVLRAVLVSEPSDEARIALLDDIGRCAREHLAEPASRYTGLGLWQTLKRTIGLWRINKIIKHMVEGMAVGTPLRRA